MEQKSFQYSDLTNSICKLNVDKNGIVHMRFWPNVVINIKQSRELYEERTRLSTPSKKQLLFVDLTTNPKPDSEARLFAKSEEVKSITKAMAMYVSNPISRVLGNLFMNIDRGDFPTKLFTNRNKALAWLRSFESSKEKLQQLTY